MPSEMREKIERFNAVSALNSINTKMVIIVVIILIGIASNAYRSWVDQTNRELTEQVRTLQSRIKVLDAKIDELETGTPMPEIKD